MPQSSGSRRSWRASHIDLPIQGGYQSHPGPIHPNQPRQRPQKEEGSTRVATVAENYQKWEQAALGRVGTAGRVMGILQNRQRKGVGRTDHVKRQLQGQRRQEYALEEQRLFDGDRRAAGEDIKGDRYGEKRNIISRKRKI
ncbi:hypothetical protein PPACK8108_LOCUS7116 [Phakopsora pachyrhizi]|uniref:Uncharacterized protein n=1 Tax=Phakopsora pachyrhizi TaxID=170000 RepID=A0AAV0ASA4_PHAPC|nr:hypothetical protein PPACK8108_LOCUS7116 [Phakopsora pachyrhizi]